MSTSETREQPVVYAVRCSTCGGFEGATTLKDGEIHRHWQTAGRQIEATSVEVVREAGSWCRCGREARKR